MREKIISVLEKCEDKSEDDTTAIDIDDIWESLGYESREACADAILKTLVCNVDYQVNSS